MYASGRKMRVFNIWCHTTVVSQIVYKRENNPVTLYIWSYNVLILTLSLINQSSYILEYYTVSCCELLCIISNVKYVFCNSNTLHLNQLCVNLNVTFMYLLIVLVLEVLLYIFF